MRVKISKVFWRELDICGLETCLIYLQFYLVNAPNRMIKQICRNISTGMCVDIPFGLGSAISSRSLSCKMFLKIFISGNFGCPINCFSSIYSGPGKILRMGRSMHYLSGQTCYLWHFKNVLGCIKRICKDDKYPGIQGGRNSCTIWPGSRDPCWKRMKLLNLFKKYLCHFR